MLFIVILPHINILPCVKNVTVFLYNGASTANTEISKSILNIMKISNAAKIFTGNSSTAE